MDFFFCEIDAIFAIHSSLFDEISHEYVHFFGFYSHTVEFTKFLYHDFLKNFRENNFFSNKEFTIKLISRNFREINCLVTSLGRNIYLT